MSAIKAPHWMVAKSGEGIDRQFRNWINQTQVALKNNWPPAEQAFCKIIDQLRKKLPRSWNTRLRYTRQKPFIVADNTVFFGDFCFQNLRLLVEIDGNTHLGVRKEADDWRDKLITAWKIETVRITNADVLERDWQETEQWFINHATRRCPSAISQRLRLDFERCHNRSLRA